MSVRRRGRPALRRDVPSATLAVRLPLPEYEALVELAARHRTTVSDIARHVMVSHPSIRITFAKIDKRVARA